MTGPVRVLFGVGVAFVAVGVVAALLRGNTSYLSLAAIGVCCAVFAVVLSREGDPR